MTDRTRRGRGDGTVHQRAATMDTNTEGEDMTLTEFLLARIAEDEAVATLARRQAESFNPWWVDGPSLKSSKYWVYDTGENFKSRGVAEHIARFDPVRMLAECEAKRRIVDGYTLAAIRAADDPDSLVRMASSETLELAVKILAQPYADHPNYLQEWKP